MAKHLFTAVARSGWRTEVSARSDGRIYFYSGPGMSVTLTPDDLRRALREYEKSRQPTGEPATTDIDGSTSCYGAHSPDIRTATMMPTEEPATGEGEWSREPDTNELKKMVDDLGKQLGAAIDDYNDALAQLAAKDEQIAELATAAQRFANRVGYLVPNRKDYASMKQADALMTLERAIAKVKS